MLNLPPNSTNLPKLYLVYVMFILLIGQNSISEEMKELQSSHFY